MISSTTDELLERNIHCPYCGEPIEVLVDVSETPQNYIEDCQVCCRPINFDITVDLDGDVHVSAMNDNE